jgi:hypothetical protein
MQLGEQIFNAIYASIPDGRATLAFSDGSYSSNCVCSSVSELRLNTEEGFGFVPSMMVKIVKTTAFDAVFPDLRKCIGANVELTKIKDNYTKSFKIGKYELLSGVITLMLGDIN